MNINITSNTMSDVENCAAISIYQYSHPPR